MDKFDGDVINLTDYRQYIGPYGDSHIAYKGYVIPLRWLVPLKKYKLKEVRVCA